MTAYRRSSVPGGAYFFTVNLADRQSRLLVDNIELLRAAFREVRRRHPFSIDAIVVLPDHIHAIWTLPQDDSNFAVRWQLIKAGFSHGMPEGETISPSRSRKRERGIWQRRYWEHTLCFGVED
jgi:putative transposase